MKRCISIGALSPGAFESAILLDSTRLYLYRTGGTFRNLYGNKSLIESDTRNVSTFATLTGGILTRPIYHVSYVAVFDLTLVPPV